LCQVSPFSRPTSSHGTAHSRQAGFVALLLPLRVDPINFSCSVTCCSVVFPRYLSLSSQIVLPHCLELSSQFSSVRAPPRRHDRSPWITQACAVVDRAQYYKEIFQLGKLRRRLTGKQNLLGTKRQDVRKNCTDAKKNLALTLQGPWTMQGTKGSAPWFKVKGWLRQMTRALGARLPLGLTRSGSLPEVHSQLV